MGAVNSRIFYEKKKVFYLFGLDKTPKKGYYYCRTPLSGSWKSRRICRGIDGLVYCGAVAG